MPMLPKRETKGKSSKLAALEQSLELIQAMLHPEYTWKEILEENTEQERRIRVLVSQLEKMRNLGVKDRRVNTFIALIWAGRDGVISLGEYRKCWKLFPALVELKAWSLEVEETFPAIVGIEEKKGK